MKKKTYLITAMLCVVGITGIFGFGKAFAGWFGDEKIDEQLKAFSYDCGGGMLGGYESLAVKKIDEGSALVTQSKAEWHHDIPKVSEYKVSAKVLEEIKDIFNEKNMAGWQKKPLSKYQVLDGDTSSFSFSFAKTRTHFSDTQDLPDKWWEGTKEMLALVRQYCERGEKLPGLVVMPRTEEEYANRSQDNKVSLEMYSYRNNYLSFNIHNGTEEKQLIKESYSLTQLSPEIKEIISLVEEEMLQLEPRYSMEKGIRLRERLGTGRYMLKFGEYSVEFEVK